MPDPTLTYPGAPASLIASWEKRRDPRVFGPGDALPPLDCDLALLARTPLPATQPDLVRPAMSFARKRHKLFAELQGKSELVLLHALLIACLRKRSWPAHAPALFRRIWAEESAHLLSTLDSRWLISAAVTFAEFGETEAQRRLGQTLNVMFSLMKLYEAERLFSGLRPEDTFELRGRVNAGLPMGMEGFSIAAGDLAVNFLAPVWSEAAVVPLVGPLALRLLDMLNADPGTVFRRLARMREKADRPPKGSPRRDP